MRLGRFPSWVGIDPVRLLLAICRCVRLDRFPEFGRQSAVQQPSRVPFSARAVKLINS